MPCFSAPLEALSPAFRSAFKIQVLNFEKVNLIRYVCQVHDHGLESVKEMIGLKKKNKDQSESKEPIRIKHADFKHFLKEKNNFFDQYQIPKIHRIEIH